MNNVKQNWIIYTIVIGIILVIASETIDAINSPEKKFRVLQMKGGRRPVCTLTESWRVRKGNWLSMAKN